MPPPSLAACHDAYALAEALAHLCQGSHPEKNGWRAKCPNHNGTSTTSLSIEPAEDRILVTCHAGCEAKAIMQALHLTMADLFVQAPPLPGAKPEIVKVYDYCDGNGVLVHQTVRYAPKGFRQRRPDPARPQRYIWNLADIEPVLYHLPDVLEAIALGHPIYLVEGEKDADVLQMHGLTATCNPMGAGKWRASYTAVLKDAHVVVLADFDDAGRRHASLVAHHLQGTVATLKVITDFHTSAKGSDIADWFAAGGTRAELDALVQGADLYGEAPLLAAKAAAPAVTQPSQDAPPLPTAVACESPGLETWLTHYSAHSLKWAPRAAPGYHAAIGLWVLSTIAARRIVVHLGSNDIYPTLFVALIAESTLWTKTTAAALGIRILRRAGCGYLLGPDRTTPQYLLKLMAGIVPKDYGTASSDEQATMRKAFGFSAQRGWFYEEWGGMLHQMRRVDSPQADLNKLLIVLEGGASSFETATIQRGLERINAPYLALLALATPHDLFPFMGEGDAWWHDGFWPRFICVTPPRGGTPSRTRMPREDYTVPPELIIPLWEWHERLGLPEVTIEERKETSGKRTGEWKGTVERFPEERMTMDTATYDAFDAYDNALSDIIHADTVHNDLAPWYSRAAQKALRVAMLLASVEGHAVITLPYWQEAQVLVEEWRSNLHDLTGTVGGEGDLSRHTMRKVRLEKKIESVLALNGAMTARELQKHLYKVSGEELYVLLESMVKIGLITRKVEGKRFLYLIFDDNNSDE
jgi:5S rRNA maturation endonuclease (ribonuclease M5)